MILFARLVLAIAGVFYGIQHFLHPASVPDIPLEKMTPSMILFPRLWGYLAGAVLLVAGIGLAVNKKPRLAATSIGALMTTVVLFIHLPLLIRAIIGSTPEINEGLNYVADTLLYAGAALSLALALPRDAEPTA